MHFIKVNELKLAQVELFWFFFFHFICVASNGPELFSKAHFENIECFLYHRKPQFFNKCKLTNLN